MGTYKRVKDVSANFRGEAVVYQVDPPMESRFHSEYVVASSITIPNGRTATDLFPSTRDGEVLWWFELPGSYTGGLNHGQAFNNAGYYEAEQP